jgi:hypothetical protein
VLAEVELVAAAASASAAARAGMIQYRTVFLDLEYSMSCSSPGPKAPHGVVTQCNNDKTRLG